MSFNLITIIVCCTVFILGCAISYFLTKTKFKKNDEEFEKLKSDYTKVCNIKNEQEKKLSDIQFKCNAIKNEADNFHRKKIEELKKKYEVLLNEANKKAKELDENLKNAVSGNFDAVTIKNIDELENLKKKIKQLEDEIEDKEDDCDELKKKLRKKEDEISEKEAKFQKETKKITDELDKVREELSNKINEIELKNNSLSFIQEILSSEEIKTKDFLKLNKEIDDINDFINNDFTNLNTHCYINNSFLSWNNASGQNGFNQKMSYFRGLYDNWSAKKRKSWLSNKKTIAFIGEFSAGKTSIVNRILSQDKPNIPKLPVSTKATTAIPTYITGGKNTEYTFVSPDGKQKTLLEETFKNVSKEILDQIKGVSSLIKYFVMTYKNPNLQGLSILDTPGFNSNDKEDMERTIEVINECDALFWVFDVNAGTVNRSSLDIIKSNLRKPLHIVINKVDTKPESEVKKVENLISQTLKDNGINVVEIIRFSSKAELGKIMNPIKNVVQDNANTSVLEKINDDLQFTYDWMKKISTDSKKEVDNLSNNIDEICNTLVNLLNNTKINCDTAASIPRWTEHFFSSDRYEMSYSEGQRLINILANISQQNLPNLDDNIGALYNNIKNYKDIESTWQIRKSVKDRTEECLNTFKKISKNLK